MANRSTRIKRGILIENDDGNTNPSKIALFPSTNNGGSQTNINGAETSGIIELYLPTVDGEHIATEEYVNGLVGGVGIASAAIQYLRLSTFNAFGSDASNKIPRFSVEEDAFGTANDIFTYTDDVATGAKFVFNDTCKVDISFTFRTDDGHGMGLSLNSSDLDLLQPILSIPVTNRLSNVYGPASDGGLTGNCSASLICVNGDVIRPHTQGITPDAANRVILTITVVKVV